MYTVGAEADEDRIQLLLKEVQGKDITELIASGREKLASVPSGGGGAVAVAAPAGGGGSAAPAAAEAKKEEKVEEKEESDDVSYLIKIYICVCCRICFVQYYRFITTQSLRFADTLRCPIQWI